MPDSFTQAIHDCAMESEDNLIVFVRTGRSFDKLRKTLISNFTRKLEEKLKQKFPMKDGWEIDVQSLINNPFEAYSGLSIRHESWQQTLMAAIETTGSCKSVIYGVCWKPEHADAAVSKDIFETMNKKIRPGLRSKYWPWYSRANRFYDWSQEDALTSMRKVVKGEFPAEILDFFYNELVAIVDNLDKCLKENHGG